MDFSCATIVCSAARFITPVYKTSAEDIFGPSLFSPLELLLLVRLLLPPLAQLLLLLLVLLVLLVLLPLLLLLPSSWLEGGEQSLSPASSASSWTSGLFRDGSDGGSEIARARP